MKNTLKKAPFKDGKPISYVSKAEYDSTEWRENTPFFAKLRLEKMGRGRSAVRLFWIDTTKEAQKETVVYEMFVIDLVEAIQLTTINEGICEGWWEFIKRGQNYGIRLMDVNDNGDKERLGWHVPK